MQRGNQHLHLYDSTYQYTLMIIAKLIGEAKQGSQAAEQLLFEKLSPRSKMLCLRYIKNNEDAEEITLDGFFKFFKALTVFSYESESGVYGFVKKIMVNECLRQLRKSHSFTISSTENSMPEIAIADEV